jgi:hypothetical protein
MFGGAMRIKLNFLLTFFLILLSSCGGLNFSIPLPSYHSALSSSIPHSYDQNEYRLVGAQSNHGSWNPETAPIMTRILGTNIFSITTDIYAESEFKIIIGTNWENGEVGPRSSGVTISVDGVSWIQYTQEDIIIPDESRIDSLGNFGAGNFRAKESGNYTISYVSLPAESRTLSFVYNGQPTVPITSELNFYLVGNFTTPTWANGLVYDNAFLPTEEENVFEKTINLMVGYEFYVVRSISGNNLWFGMSGMGVSLLPESLTPTIYGTDRFLVNVDGQYKITVTNGTFPSIVFLRLSDPVIEIDSGHWFLVGTITENGEQGSSWNPEIQNFNLTPVSGEVGAYEITLYLKENDNFKIKTGNSWEEGRDIGFSNVIKTPMGAFANSSENIQSLVSGTFRIIFYFSPSEGTIVIENKGWIGYGFNVYDYDGITEIPYVGPNTFFLQNVQYHLLTPFDGSKQGVEFSFIGKPGDTYLFKVEQIFGLYKEAFIVATGQPQTLSISLAEFSEDQRSMFNLFVLFMMSPNSEGIMLITGWRYLDSVEDL